MFKKDHHGTMDDGGIGGFGSLELTDPAVYIYLPTPGIRPLPIKNEDVAQQQETRVAGATPAVLPYLISSVGRVTDF